MTINQIKVTATTYIKGEQTDQHYTMMESTGTPEDCAQTIHALLQQAHGDKVTIQGPEVKFTAEDGSTVYYVYS